MPRKKKAQGPKTLEEWADWGRAIATILSTPAPADEMTDRDWRDWAKGTYEWLVLGAIALADANHTCKCASPHEHRRRVLRYKLAEDAVFPDWMYGIYE